MYLYKKIYLHGAWEDDYDDGPRRSVYYKYLVVRWLKKSGGWKTSKWRWDGQPRRHIYLGRLLIAYGLDYDHEYKK